MAGRFPPGTRVRLVRVKDESVLRAEGGEEVATAKVGEDGRVQFTEGVDVGGRYFITGYAGVDGYREVRVRGNAAGEESTVLTNPGFAPDRAKLADGSFADEAPEKVKAPAEGAPHLGQQHLSDDVPQRSNTPRGQATPVTPGESVPKPRQEDVPKSVPQMSSTETGEAAPIISGPAAQADVPKGTPQRSQTERGIAVPIPQGGGVEAQREKESGLAKAARGEPGKAATSPLGAKEVKAPAERKPAENRRAPADRASKAAAKPVAESTAKKKES